MDLEDALVPRSVPVPALLLVALEAILDPRLLYPAVLPRADPTPLAEARRYPALPEIDLEWA